MILWVSIYTAWLGVRFCLRSIHLFCVWVYSIVYVTQQAWSTSFILTSVKLISSEGVRRCIQSIVHIYRWAPFHRLSYIFWYVCSYFNMWSENCVPSLTKIMRMEESPRRSSPWRNEWRLSLGIHNDRLIVMSDVDNQFKEHSAPRSFPPPTKARWKRCVRIKEAHTRTLPQIP